MTHDARVTTRVPAALRDALDRQAALERHDLSDEVRRALWLHVERCDLRSDEAALTGGPVQSRAVEEPARGSG